MTHQILEGIRVIDWTMYQLGPVNTQMLAAMGAEVIHIESPRGDLGRYLTAFAGTLVGGKGLGRGGSDLGVYHETHNRLKKSMVLDLTKPRAKEIMYELVAKCDVFVQNMRFGVAQKQGMDYDTLKKINPKLIYWSGSSFGTKGPDSSKPGFDMSGAARAAAMFGSSTGSEDPMWALPGMYDQIGAIFGSYGILAALYARDRFGVGQEVETSHMTATMWLIGSSIQQSYYRNDFPRSNPARDKANMPLFNTYRCKDGEWIGLACIEADRHWPHVCAALGIPDSIRDSEDFGTTPARRRDTGKTIAMLDGYFAKKTREELIKDLEGKDVFWEKVQRMTDLATDPQVIANQYMTDYEHPLTGQTYKYQHIPMQFSKTPAMRMGRAPLLGEHTEEILVDWLGYKKEEVPGLLDEIGRPIANA